MIAKLALRQLISTSHGADSALAHVAHWAADFDKAASIVLDFDDGSFHGVSSTRLSPLSLTVLANLLSNRYAHLPIEVKLPKSESLRAQLARSALLYSLCRRPGHTVVDWDEAPDAWMRSWHPMHLSSRQESLDVRSSDEYALSPLSPNQRYMLSLPDPHKRPRESVAREVRRPLVRPWLLRRFEGLAPNPALYSLVTGVSVIMGELVENVCDHAELRASDSRSMSLAQLYATRSGGKESWNRFYMMVCDNGLGIAQSIARRDESVKTRSAVEVALRGELPRYGRDRGWGLARVAEIVAAAEAGRAFFVTGSGSGDAAVAVSFEADRLITIPVKGLPVQGTMVFIQLALRQSVRQPSSTEQQQLEFEFDRGVSSAVPEDLMVGV